MKGKIKVLCLFDYLCDTGFGTVSKNIVSELKKEFGNNLVLHICAINYFGENFYQDENTYIISAKNNDEKSDAYGRFLFLKMINDIDDYDGVFVCQDLGIIVPIIQHLEYIKQSKKENNKKSFKSIFYFPIDNQIVWELTEGLEFFDLLVTYTEFAKNQIVKHRPELKTKIKVIPHGNNPKDFYELTASEKIKFRKEYFGDNADKFIISNINRNQPRKDIPNTIFGFIEAKKNWKELNEPFLYLHCNPKDALGWDITALMHQTDLVEDVDYKLIPYEYENFYVDVETLNKIYNASDCYLTTTMGEGWGLTYSEAAACKLPIIAPYSTSFIEMSENGKNAFMLYTLYPFCGINDSTIRQQTDLYEVADTIIEVAKQRYSGGDEISTKTERNYKWSKSLDWKIVCKSWINYFKEVF
jgi:glycosyltransferase involved in cell wall biosynthesis